MKAKKTAAILSIVIALVLSVTAQAFAISEDETDNSNYYTEKGQINLENLSINAGKNEVIVGGKDNINRQRFIDLLSKSPNVKTVISEGLQNGEEPVAIGYTRVYLKEVTDEDGEIHVEPYTKAEMLQSQLKSTGSGPDQKYGNLTLYTYASTSTNGITVKSIAQWSDKYQLSGQYMQAPGEDYISAATSTKYALTSASFAGTMSNGYALNSKFVRRVDNGPSSVVYAFTDMATGAFMVDKATVTMNCAKNGTLPSSITCRSKYVHTYNTTSASVGVSISFDSAGANFSFSNTAKAWQIASSVIVSK